MENPLILKERYLILYKLTPIMMLANLLASPILVTLMWDVVPHKVLIIWLASVSIACSLTLIFYLYLKPRFKSLKTIPEYPIYYILPFIFGSLWGAAGYLFFTPDSMTHTAYLIIFLFGMASGSINALSALWFSQVILATTILLPFTFRLFMHGYSHSYLLGLTLLSFLAIIIVIGRMSNNSITQTLKIRYENANLVKDLQHQTEQALKANKDKSRFLAAASHDLRQPIHSLSLLTSALTPEITSTRGKKILDQINNANQAMLNLLHSLLDISKLDAGVIKPEIKVVNMAEVIDSLVAEFKPVALENGLQLRSRRCNFITRTDPILLATIIRNLLQNAIRYTPQGKILIACRKRGTSIHLQVWDTGKGIAKADQEIIFAEYQQLHNPERDQNKGLGLGLSICKRLGLLLDIPISLQSQPGKGSVFTLELPLLPTSDSQSIHSMAPKKPASVSTNRFDNTVILVIDDNHSVLEAMSTLLEGWGCKVLTADSIETTLEVVQQSPDSIDAVIADYRLRHDTTGVDAINKLKKTYALDIPSVLITGDTAPEQMQEIEAHGLPILHKPIKEPHLKAVIHRLLTLSV